MFQGVSQMPKLVLLDSEAALIRGLAAHTSLNNQAITAIFSHLDRNINNREIGTIRVGKGKYAKIAPATKPEVDDFLAKYGRLQASARKLGVLPSDQNIMRIDKALELMRAAVSIYNNPALSFRTEMFIVNAMIAWTYALHAFYLKNWVNPVYRDGAGKPVKAPDGNHKLWDLSTCLDFGGCPLGAGEKSNLKYLLLLRHEIEHRCARDIDESVQPKVQACAINFSDFCENRFGKTYSLKPDLVFALQFAAITMSSPHAEKNQKDLPAAIQAVNALHEGEMTEAEYNDPRYAYRVYVVPKTVNNPKKADQAVTFAPTGSTIELAIKHVERPKYREKDVINQMKSEGFKITTNRFRKFWKALDAKNPKKGLATQLGGQWFWYDEMLKLVRDALKAGKL